VHRRIVDEVGNSNDPYHSAVLQIRVLVWPGITGTWNTNLTVVRLIWNDSGWTADKSNLRTNILYIPYHSMQ